MAGVSVSEPTGEGELAIDLRVEARLTRITLRGCVNMETAEVLAESVQGSVEHRQNPRFLFDVRELEYVSSAGVGVFLDLYERYEGQGGRLAFLGLRAAVRRVFDLVGFLSFFGDFTDEGAALAYLERP